MEETIEIIKIGHEELPEAHKAERRVQFSEETEKILEERGKAAREKNTEEFNKKSKEFRKSKKNDKREAVLKAINKDMDELTKDFPIQRIRFSKYCFGLEKLYHL